MSVTAHRNDLLERTIESLERAQGYFRVRIPVSEVRRPDFRESSSLASLSTMPALQHIASEHADWAQHDGGQSMSPSSSGNNAQHVCQAEYPAHLMAIIDNQQARLFAQASTVDAAVQRAHQCREESQTSLLLATRSRVRWAAATGCSFGVWIVYISWCAINSVEFEFIRQRQRGVVGLGVE